MDKLRQPFKTNQTTSVLRLGILTNFQSMSSTLILTTMEDNNVEEVLHGKQKTLHWDPFRDARFEHWTNLHSVMLMDDIHDFIVGISRMPFLSGWTHMGVSLNGGTPKSSILIGFSIINHPFWGTHIFGNIHILSGTSVLSATVIHHYDSEQIQLQQIRPHATPAQKKRQQQKHHQYEKIRTRFNPVLFPLAENESGQITIIPKPELVGGFNPLEKYYIVKLDHFPKQGWKYFFLKPPSSIIPKPEWSGHVGIYSVTTNTHHLRRNSQPLDGQRWNCARYFKIIYFYTSYLPAKRMTGWWLNQPIWKICPSNWKPSPSRGENKTYLKPPPSNDMYAFLLWRFNQKTTLSPQFPNTNIPNQAWLQSTHSCFSFPKKPLPLSSSPLFSGL